MSAKPLKFTYPCPLSLPPVPRAEIATSGKTRILVAEDDPVSRELICARLEKWGYEVVVTENGQDAMMELRKKDAPSLVILDWTMPGMDGLEICRRERDGERAVYIILLTARGTKENMIAGLAAGADDYLIKPFDADELQARILVGRRAMDFQNALVDRLSQLGEAAGEIRGLKARYLM